MVAGGARGVALGGTHVALVFLQSVMGETHSSFVLKVSPCKAAGLRDENNADICALLCVGRGLSSC